MGTNKIKEYLVSVTTTNDHKNKLRNLKSAYSVYYHEELCLESICRIVNEARELMMLLHNFNYQAIGR